MIMCLNPPLYLMLIFLVLDFPELDFLFLLPLILVILIILSSSWVLGILIIRKELMVYGNLWNLQDMWNLRNIWVLEVILRIWVIYGIFHILDIILENWIIRIVDYLNHLFFFKNLLLIVFTLRSEIIRLF